MRTRSKALVALALTAMLLPAFYMTASSLTRNLAAPVRSSQYSQYSTAKESQVNINDVQKVLATLAQIMNPNQLNLLQEKLRGLAPLPGQNDPLGEYIETLENFSVKMDEIHSSLDDAQLALAAQNTKQATYDFQQLNNLRENAGSLLQSLSVLLDSISAKYGIDIGAQRQKVEAFGALFQSYSSEIDQLGARLRAQQGYVPTMLNLNASKSEVFVNESVTVYGVLRSQNGTALAGKGVTITWIPNQRVLRQTDVRGRFEANISYPIGVSAGTAVLQADFVPQGNDGGVYLASTALLNIKVTYRPSILAAVVLPEIVRPSSYATVRGTLSTTQAKPLAGRTIIVQIDRALMGNSTTDGTGGFNFVLYVPPTMSNGTHSVTVFFPANQDVFAPSNVNLPIDVVIIGTRTLTRTDRGSLLSGMNVVVRGNVTYPNGTAPTGENVTIFLDGLAYSNVTIQEDGSYLSVVRVPIWTSFGNHVIKAAYLTQNPSVQGSDAVAIVFVYNTPLIIIGAVSISAAFSAGFYLTRKRRRTVLFAAPSGPAPVPLAEPARIKFSPEGLVSKINAERSHTAKIRKCFMLAQAIIDQDIGKPARSSETHWEYFSRVTMSIPKTSDLLRHLVEIYEVAEYTPYPIEHAQSREAIEVLLELWEEIETVK